MDHTTREPTLEEMLADPIVQLLMKRDNVAAEDVRRLFCKARDVRCRELGRNTRDGPTKGEDA